MRFYDHVDTWTLLFWSISDRTRATRALVAGHRIANYVSAARAQVYRIQEALTAADSAARRNDFSWSNYQQQAFVDLHFYFICWDTIAKMIETIWRSGSKAAHRVYRKHATTLKRYQSARDFLEHFDERLPGGPQVRRMRQPGDLGNLTGGAYTFGGERCDIGLPSLKMLDRIAADLSHELRAEALERLERQQRTRPEGS